MYLLCSEQHNLHSMTKKPTQISRLTRMFANQNFPLANEDLTRSSIYTSMPHHRIYKYAYKNFTTVNLYI